MATFGKTSNGASSTLHNAGRLTLSQAVLSEAAILSKGWFRSLSSNTTQAKHFKFVIYSDNAGEPDALLHTSAEATYTSTSAAFRDAAFAGESLAAGTYWIGAIYDGNGTTSVTIQRDNTVSLARTRTNTYASGAPNPVGTVVSLNGKIDAYVEYTPASGGSVAVKVKVSSAFVAAAPKVKVSSAFVSVTPKYKSGGTFA